MRLFQLCMVINCSVHSLASMHFRFGTVAGVGGTVAVGVGVDGEGIGATDGWTMQCSGRGKLHHGNILAVIELLQKQKF